MQKILINPYCRWIELDLKQIRLKTALATVERSIYIIYHMGTENRMAVK